MTLAMDLPESPPSLVRRLDPRWKLAAILLAVIGLALLRTSTGALIGLAGALLLVGLARLPWRWFVARLASAAILFLLLLIWLPFLVHENHELLALGPITISETGSLRLLLLSARFAAMTSLVLVLAATAPLQDTFKAAAALRVPGLLIHLVLLAYRYTFLMLDEFHRMRIALRVRGFRAAGNLHTYRMVGHIAGALLMRGAERSERVGQAMRCRGFDGQFRTLHSFRTRWQDAAAFLVMVSFVALLLAWEWYTLS